MGRMRLSLLRNLPLSTVTARISRSLETPFESPALGVWRPLTKVVYSAGSAYYQVRASVARACSTEARL